MIPSLLRALFEACAEFEARGVRYALIGGIAASVHGIQRTTRDVDLLLAVDSVAVPGLVDGLERRGFTVDREVVTSQLVRDGLSRLTFQGVRVDLLRCVLPFFFRVVERAERFDAGEASVRIARPEDVILLKLLADRGPDREDILGIAATVGRLDTALLLDEASGLFAADDPRPGWLRSALVGPG